MIEEGGLQISSFNNEFLFYSAEGPVPAGTWADFFFGFGRSLFSAQHKTRVILVLPTLELAAPLLSFGYLYESFSSTPSSNDNTLDSFREIERGAPLIIASDKGDRHATFESVLTLHGQEYVSVHVKSQKVSKQWVYTKEFLKPHELKRVTILSKEAEGTKSKIVGRPATGLANITKHIFSTGDVPDLSNKLNKIWLFGSRLECENELCKVGLGLHSETAIKLYFNDVLRMDQFLGKDEPVFTRLYSSFKRETEYDVPTQEAKIVIFRGGYGVLKHKSSFSHAHQIVLMDYADPLIADVINAYNQSYVGNRTSDLEMHSEIPDGLIVSGFLEENTMHAN